MTIAENRATLLAQIATLEARVETDPLRQRMVQLQLREKRQLVERCDQHLARGEP